MRRTLGAIAIALCLAPRVNAQEGPRALFPWLQLFQLAGGPTSFREDSVHTSGQFGNFVLAVRNDAGGSLCGTTGDYCALQLDSTGQLRVVAAQAGAPWSVSGSGTFTIAGTVVQGNQGTHAQRWMVGLSDGSGSFISPATDRTTAAAPFSLRLSDGAAFYNTNTAAQLPAALDGSGFLKVHEQGMAGVNLAQVVGTAADVNSGNKSAGTLRVVLATDQPALTNKLLVTPDSVALPANQSVNVAQFGGTNAVTGTGASGSGIPRVTVANDSNVIVTPPTLTKGTQGATGFSTQDLHDAGRTAISFYANNVAAGTTTTETLITLTQSKGTGATSSAASYTITNGKTLRLTAIQVAARGHATATIQSTVFNLRLNTAGACIVSSTPILMGAQAATAAVASAWDRVIIPIPDGYEIAGNGTIAICISAAATYVTNAPTWSVNLIGYEY